MNSTRYQNLMQYVLPLMAISSLISQTLVDFFLIICVCHWLYYFTKERNQKEFLPHTGLEWSFLGLFIAMLLSILVNYWGRWEFLWPVLKIKWIFEFYAMLWFLRRYGFSVEKTVKTILWVGLIPATYSIATFFNGIDFLNPDRVTSERVVGLVNSATYHAHAGAILLGLSIFPLIAFKMYRGRIGVFNIGCAILAFASFYLTYTRGALLAFVIGVLVFAYSKGTKMFLVSCVGVLLAFSVVYVFSPQLKMRVEQTIDPEKMDQSRIGLFKAYVEVFLDHKFFGSGYDAYKKDGSLIVYTKRNGVRDELLDSHSHNQYLQFAATTGVFGLMSFLWILYNFALLCFKALRGQKTDERYLLYWVPVFVIIISLMLTDQTFEYAKIRAPIVFVFALISSFACEKSCRVKAV